MNSTPSAPFIISVICTGNLCRSPLAQRLLAREFAGINDLLVTSGGTSAALGVAVPAEAQAAARHHGVDISGHRPRLFAEDDLAASGLVLGMEREHRKAAVLMQARASRRTFTLREFALLSEAITDHDLSTVSDVDPYDTQARLTKAVALIASRRGHLLVTRSPDVWDIADPYRASRHDYDRAADAIDEAIRQTSVFMSRALGA